MLFVPNYTFVVVVISSLIRLHSINSNTSVAFVDTMAESINLRNLNKTNLTKLHGTTRNSVLLKLKDFGLETLEAIRTHSEAITSTDVSSFDKLKSTISGWG